MQPNGISHAVPCGVRLVPRLAVFALHTPIYIRCLYIRRRLAMCLLMEKSTLRSAERLSGILKLRTRLVDEVSPGLNI
jgi:hypothetical protein